jgi:hypothetical protein
MAGRVALDKAGPVRHVTERPLDAKEMAWVNWTASEHW